MTADPITAGAQVALSESFVVQRGYRVWCSPVLRLGGVDAWAGSLQGSIVVQ